MQVGIGLHSGIAVAFALSLTGCDSLSLPTSMAAVSTVGTDRAAITVPGDLPSPPKHVWLKDAVDVNEHRAEGWGLVSMPDMETYLNGLLRKIKSTTGTTDWPGSVHILADPSLNAGSSAAGNIYISIGWLQATESEDEIFAILSHEYGHIYLNHHSAYTVSNAGDTSLLLASLGWSYANRKVADTGWNGLDKMQLVQIVGASVLMPAWERSLEEQADLFGATVSLRCGYSYIHGFKAFLERIDSYDRKARTEREELQKQQDWIARDIIKQQTLSKIAATQGKPGVSPEPSLPLPQSGVSGALSDLSHALNQLNVTLTDGQVALNQGTFDVQRSINISISATLAQIHETHPDGSIREDYLSKQFAELIRHNRPPAKNREWEAARKRGKTSEILAHYSLGTKVSDLEAAKDPQGALKLASQAASGATTNDAALVEYLANATGLAHTQKFGTATDILMRNLKSPERSWRVQVDIANLMATSDRGKARQLLEEQFEYFGKVPKIWPDVIAFYLKIGDEKQSKQMATACAIASPGYRNACLTASQTPAERAQMMAKTDAHSTIVVEQVKKKWFK
ncbi:M48 family metalloprotease [Paraburkholderia caribensis]|uniref:M48 family metalloprotease n=1 Tax=Paraburkholderia caribensis TaxID=75105 RepID=UPI0031D3E5F4